MAPPLLRLLPGAPDGAAARRRVLLRGRILRLLESAASLGGYMPVEPSPRYGGLVRRVLVVGCSGTGKTTLGRELGRRLSVPFVELDAIHHLSGWQERAADDFRAEVRTAITGDGWVVDGNYQSKLGDLVEAAADTIVWLDYDRSLAMRRVVRRTLRRVATREELWNGNREPWSNLWSRDPYKSIIAWTWTQHAAYRQRYEAAVDQRWVRLRTPSGTDRWLASVSPAAASA